MNRNADPVSGWRFPAEGKWTVRGAVGVCASAMQPIKPFAAIKLGKFNHCAGGTFSRGLKNGGWGWTGHRRRKSPYQLRGLYLPTPEWWELLRLTPEQLRQHLQGAHHTAAEPPQKVSARAAPEWQPQEVSAHGVAA